MPRRAKQTFGLRDMFEAWGRMIALKDDEERKQRLTDAIMHLKIQIKGLENRLAFDRDHGIETPKLTFERIEQARQLIRSLEIDLCQKQVVHPPAPPVVGVGSNGGNASRVRGAPEKSVSQRSSVTSWVSDALTK